MRAFEVRLNGKRLCTAGFDGDGVLNTVVNHVVGNDQEHMEMRVGGLISATDEFVDWYCAKLKVGDRIALKIIETNSPDPPTQRSPKDAKKLERYTKNSVLQSAKKFGWRVVKRPGKSK